MEIWYYADHDGKIARFYVTSSTKHFVTMHASVDDGPMGPTKLAKVSSSGVFCPTWKDAHDHLVTLGQERVKAFERHHAQAVEDLARVQAMMPQ